jgi:hypothetical protein
MANSTKVVLAGVVFAAGAMAAALQGEYKGWGFDEEKNASQTPRRSSNLGHGASRPRQNDR